MRNTSSKARLVQLVRPYALYASDKKQEGMPTLETPIPLNSTSLSDILILPV